MQPASFLEIYLGTTVQHAQLAGSCDTPSRASAIFSKCCFIFLLGVLGLGAFCLCFRGESVPAVLVQGLASLARSVPFRASGLGILPTPGACGF